jgi:outer membrane biosynthesis protein TonB
MLAGRSGDPARLSERAQSLPSRRKRRPWLTRGGPSSMRWTTAGLVVIGAAVAVAVTYPPARHIHGGTPPAVCGLVLCADMPTAPAGKRPGHRRPGRARSRPVPPDPPARSAKLARSPRPVHRSSPQPGPTSKPEPEPTPTAVPSPSPAPTTAPAPTPSPSSSPSPTPDPTRDPGTHDGAASGS